MKQLKVEDLRSQAQGAVLSPSDVGFGDAHRGCNLAETHSPDLVVCAEQVSDVSAAVRFGAEHGLSVRAQATCHGIGLPMAGGVLVNTSGMQGLSVDGPGRTARVSAGVRWHDVVETAAEHGLATLCGSSPTVGVVDYTLGGGMGPMARTFGFAFDRVLRLQMVDATGAVREIDTTTEPDLFSTECGWARNQRAINCR